MAKLGFDVTNFHFIVILFIGLVNPIKCDIHIPNRPLKNNVTKSLFIFGDSLFDSGNNNYINTSLRANFFPYGETFFRHPTGRFSDGRLIPDFIAEYAKLPLIPPYLQPHNHEFVYGVNFASSGAGVLIETRRGLVIDLKTQLGYFKNVGWQLRAKLGDAEATALLSRAVYFFSAGINDYIAPFATNSSVHRSYSTEQFVGLVIGNITEVIKEIYKVGGRKFAFENLAPLGCSPLGRVLQGEKGGACFKKITPYLKLHNEELPVALRKLQIELKGFKYSLTNLYSSLEDIINHPSKYGFKDGKTACCGSGPYRGISSCGGKGEVKKYHLCSNVSEYVFFDSVHPSERVIHILSKQAWNGKPSLSGPYNLKALFESE